jgi:hypothetical protein
MFEPIFLGKYTDDFKFKNMLRISKTLAFLFTKGMFFENDVLKSKMMRKVKNGSVAQ